MGSRWDQVPVIEAPGRCVPLPYRGWSLMLAWAAGPGRTARRRGSFTEVQPAPFALAGPDPEKVRAEADAYLAAAGIPPVPEGFLWFLLVPEWCRSVEAFRTKTARLIREGAAEVGAGQGGPETAAELLSVFEDVLAAMYAGGPGEPPAKRIDTPPNSV